jgi:hypothetical protein
MRWSRFLLRIDYFVKQIDVFFFHYTSSYNFSYIRNIEQYIRIRTIETRVTYSCTHEDDCTKAFYFGTIWAYIERVSVFFHYNDTKERTCGSNSIRCSFSDYCRLFRMTIWLVKAWRKFFFFRFTLPLWPEIWLRYPISFPVSILPSTLFK